MPYSVSQIQLQWNPHIRTLKGPLILRRYTRRTLKPDGINEIFFFIFFYGCVLVLGFNIKQFKFLIKTTNFFFFFNNMVQKHLCDVGIAVVSLSPLLCLFQ